MPSSTPHAAYLNDHLAGSVAALDLLGKMRSTNEGTEFGRVLDGLERDIEEDRDALLQVIETLGVKTDTVKQAGGRILEKLSRIKFDDHVTGSGELSRLMETEALSLGIAGKLAGWRALKEASRADLGVDLDRLIERAQEQRRTLEPFRIDAARRVFGEREANDG
jgi:hypothetical protein